MKNSKTPFLDTLEPVYRDLIDHCRLSKMRSKAWDRLQTLGIPPIQQESYQYLHLRSLLNEAYSIPVSFGLDSKILAPYLLEEPKTTTFVFVNGTFQPQLSITTHLPSRVTHLSLPEALPTYGTFLNSRWSKIAEEEQDPFAVLNTALHQVGSFIYIPPRTIIDHPIHFLHLVNPQDKSLLVQPRIHLFIGAQSEVSFVSSIVSLSENRQCFSGFTDFMIEEGAQVKYYQEILHNTEESWIFDATRAHLKKDSSFKTVGATSGSATVRQDYRMTLAGSNCEASLNGVWVLDEKKEAHVHVLMDHQAPFCKSTQLFKGVLRGFSRSSFEGKILVQKTAHGTDAFQLNNNLILTEHAVANSKPNLEVFTDDVKASHGATVGQLDEEQLFYMKTRGISKKVAERLLTQGFVSEVLDLIPLDSFRNRLGRTINTGPLC